MSVTLNPIPTDGVNDNVQESGLGISGVAPQAIEQIHTNNADLYKNIDPSIDESGIIRDMTIKPQVAHSVDLENQISSALKSGIDAQPVALVSHIDNYTNGGAVEYMAGQELMGGATFAPEHPTKLEPAQSPQPPQKPTIIMGEM